MTRSTLDNPRVFNRATGNPVTYFYTPDGHYVVIDSVTQEVVQMSNTFDPEWIDEMTGQVIMPIQ